jgi:hypothetical protein
MISIDKKLMYPIKSQSFCFLEPFWWHILKHSLKAVVVRHVLTSHLYE